LGAGDTDEDKGEKYIQYSDQAASHKAVLLKLLIWKIAEILTLGRLIPGQDGIRVKTWDSRARDILGRIWDSELSDALSRSC
jgi:hypothetical protein